MQLKSRIIDSKIGAENILLEMTYEEYLEIAKDILMNNPLQRKRVKSSNTVYSLLKKDLLEGCIMPPIVLALNLENDSDFFKLDNESIIDLVKSNIENLLILDGLQRTHTLKDLESELREETNDFDKFIKFRNGMLRVEIYIGINQFGILYRMLTLNTGQTPMSLRHQIEILYRKYLDNAIEGIEIVQEVNKDTASPNAYHFKTLVEGFNSYLERDPAPIDRFDVLNNIKSLERLSNENTQNDLFKDFVLTYDNLIKAIDNKTSANLSDDEVLDELSLYASPFSKNTIGVFNKSQAITGFGAAIGKLKDLEVIENLDEVRDLVNKLEVAEDEDWIVDLIKNLDSIKQNSKKIGNAQRMYFYWIFRELFNENSDAYTNLYEAVQTGYKKYQLTSE
ncbi:hypothetical protein [Planomicrobium sp. CPCC 101079]|uniref:hypothetical protein n=1 Tax=Planomicrobium sp. CPCC 101079 TaxID=2599618 RepID=UPI0011B3A61D|nr:hypothetical protein [Planomicrobium sp. CPCC 101079]TWT00594.1 hypothetical protein FQV28_17970 [Planomicrobium sp. CPCC 101079]